MSQSVDILILCTGNSARSILGEALISSLPGFRGHSAGSTPKGAPHPMALRLLQEKGHDTTGLTSKSWDVFAAPDAPRMQAVITVCDNAAGENCPYWPGQPVQAHWGLPDPAAAPDDTLRAAFEAAYDALAHRVARLPELAFDGTVPAAELRARLQAIHDEA